MNLKSWKWPPKGVYVSRDPSSTLPSSRPRIRVNPSNPKPGSPVNGDKMDTLPTPLRDRSGDNFDHQQTGRWGGKEAMIVDDWDIAKVPVTQ
eukprot:2408852-Rhodomonas_salina.9